MNPPGRAHSPNISVAGHEPLRKGLTKMIHTLNALNSRRDIPILLREMELVKYGSAPHAFCHAASGSSLAAHSDGSLFPCGQTMGDPLFNCGSVSQPNEVRNNPLRLLQLQSENCTNCPLQRCCPGECPSRLYYNRDNTPTLICELYKTLKALL